MSQLEVLQLPVLQDNYIFLVHHSAQGETAVIDPAVSEEVLKALDQKGWNLTHILNTHHHPDHIGGNLELKEVTGCQIWGSAKDRHRIPGIDHFLKNGDMIPFGQSAIEVIETPGHTLGHICFHFSSAGIAFVGDTLFAMGCGRIFEGTAAQMLQSLKSLAALPLTTKVYCAHEYTLNNGRFALSIEPDNHALTHRMEKVRQRRQANQPTIPTTIAEERLSNPFLRTHLMSVQQSLDMVGRAESEIFAKLRHLKDSF
jgi:hydroxyacylglutathione hydrolase